MTTLEQARTEADACNYSEAIRLGRVALDEGESVDEAVALIMFCLTMTGRCDLAIRERLSHEECGPYTATEVLRAESAIGNIEEALAASRLALEKGADRAEVHYLLGQLWLRLGKPEAALEHYRVAPGDPRAMAGMVTSLGMLGRLEEAGSLAREANERFPNDRYVLRAEVRLCRMMGDLEEARRKAAALLELEPRDCMSLVQLALIEHESSEFHAAIQTYNEALDLWPNFADALMGRARSLLAQGKTTEAIRDYKTVLANNPGHVLAASRLLEIYRKRFNLVGAWKMSKSSPRPRLVSGAPSHSSVPQ